MTEKITLLCDECHEDFEIEMGIGLSMLAFADPEEGGDPILCPTCCPSAQNAQDEFGDDVEYRAGLDARMPSCEQ